MDTHWEVTDKREITRALTILKTCRAAGALWY
ncbi:hypothetical protein SAMN05192558_10768 [Actinokineospora alba]|uniref:Uncharacterized protein n=1 Tax=Actinokineospora alba TaxID=504798 RepID=A0A1H0QNX2_9PSEU|nr:hypothetical protein C8E96_6083 [Actinokineospora alba]SDI30805.1 hypothetical protein SAMN05421871_10467 [Actinokineospora alba]SDP18775.1 hypothetical protein SAMN05192558_10768 [Actinokineospora alba]